MSLLSSGVSAASHLTQGLLAIKLYACMWTCKNSCCMSLTMLTVFPFMQQLMLSGFVILFQTVDIYTRLRRMSASPGTKLRASYTVIKLPQAGGSNTSVHAQHVQTAANVVVLLVGACDHGYATGSSRGSSSNNRLHCPRCQVTIPVMWQVQTCGNPSHVANPIMRQFKSCCRWAHMTTQSVHL